MPILKIALASTVLISTLLATPTLAGVLFTEDFSGATPGTYGTGPLPGTNVTVTTFNVDVVGVLNGSFFTCTDNPGGNCLDLVGNDGGGGIASVPTFTLTAGDTYTVKFGAVLQGYAPGQGSTTFDVGLGSLVQSEMVNGTTQQFSLTFSPLVTETNAALSFTTVIPGDGSHGAVLDNISLSEIAGSSAVPEPSSWAVMLLGFGGIGSVIRGRRRATDVFQAGAA